MLLYDLVLILLNHAYEKKARRILKSCGKLVEKSMLV